MALGIGHNVSGLVCPKHPMVSATGKETGKAGNSPGLGPEFHQHQNLLAIHITEGLGNRRRDILPAGQPRGLQAHSSSCCCPS